MRKINTLQSCRIIDNILQETLPYPNNKTHPTSWMIYIIIPNLSQENMCEQQFADPKA